MLDDQHLAGILTDHGLAQFGDALLNFVFSLALTETTGRPRGTKVSDKTLAEAAARAGLRKYLPRRIGGGGYANRKSYRITLLSRVENNNPPRSKGPSRLKDSATSHSVTSDHRLYRQPCPRSRLQALWEKPTTTVDQDKAGIVEPGENSLSNPVRWQTARTTPHCPSTSKTKYPQKAPAG